MKTVIEMAREAGFLISGVQEFVFAPSSFHFTEELKHFAELVRADERNRLADKLQQDFKGAFGADTCASWASWIRGQK